MRERTDRIRIPEELSRPAPSTGGTAGERSTSGEIRVSHSAHDVPVPRPSRSVVVRGRRHFYG